MKLIPRGDVNDSGLKTRPETADAEAEDAGALRLEDFLPYRLSVLANTVSRGIARQYADRFGLSIPEWRVMAVLGRFAPLSAGEVCERTRMDKVRVSRAVARLSDAGLIARRADAADRRRGLLRLSPAGRAVHREIVPLARAREAELLAALDPQESAQLDALVAKLQHRADVLDE